MTLPLSSAFGEHNGDIFYCTVFESIGTATRNSVFSELATSPWMAFFQVAT